MRTRTKLLITGSLLAVALGHTVRKVHRELLAADGL